MERIRRAASPSSTGRPAASAGCRRTGSPTPELDPVIMVEILGAMVDQTCYIWFFLGKEFDPAAVVESLTTAWAAPSASGTPERSGRRDLPGHPLGPGGRVLRSGGDVVQAAPGGLGQDQGEGESESGDRGGEQQRAAQAQ